MKIKVEQRHIDNGKRLDCKRCAVALAVADAFPGFDVYANVDEIFLERIDHAAMVSGAVFSDCYDCKSFNVPHEVADFIRKFDEPIRQTGLKPFEFELV